MKKRIFHPWSIIGCIITIIFNVVFFILTADDAVIGRSITTWFSYGFIHVALLFLIIAPAFINKGLSFKDTAMSVLTTCIVYWLMELILGMFFVLLTSPSAVESIIKPLLNTLSVNIGTKFLYNWIFEILNSDPNKFGIITQTILFGLFIITLITLVVINRDTEEKEIRHEQEFQYIKKAEMQLKLKIHEINDKEVSHRLEQLYDYIRTSPLKSTTELRQIESKIMDDIQNIMQTDDKEQIFQLIDDALRLTKQRNLNLSLKNREL